MSHEPLCRCQRCQADELTDLILTGARDEPRSSAEEAEQRRQDYVAGVIHPALDFGR